MRLTCPRQQSVDTHLLAWAARVAAGLDRAVVVAIGGYAYVGKTSLAHRLVDEWPLGGSFLLPTEAVIAPRQQRLADRHDGCSADAHDVRLLASLIDDLRHGAPRLMSNYSWEHGRSVGRRRAPGLGALDLLVVDGSVTNLDEIRCLVDISVHLLPSDVAPWVEAAVDRDVRQRSWSAKQAAGENRRKLATVHGQLRRGPEPDMVVSVQAGGTWLAAVPGCLCFGQGLTREVDDEACTNGLCLLEH